MRIRTAAIAAAVAATALGAAAHADAQTDARTILKLVNGGIETADCRLVGTALRSTGLVGADTTRGQLVTNLNQRISTDPALRLLAGTTVTAVADRAVGCNVVKPDPVTPQNVAIALSSQLSSQAGLPELRNYLPAIAP